MLYEIAVEGRIHRVRVESCGDGRFTARVGDREISGTWRPGLLVVEGEPAPYAVDRDAAGMPREIVLRGRAHEVAVTGMGYRRSEARGGAGEGSGGSVTAPMNGQVLKLLAGEGQEVEAGQVVLVLEAMKMENEVTAPLAGVVSRLEVRPGEAVHPGRLLFEVVPNGSPPAE